jgi:hypothetical protein
MLIRVYTHQILREVVGERWHYDNSGLCTEKLLYLVVDSLMFEAQGDSVHRPTKEIL